MHSATPYTSIRTYSEYTKKGTDAETPVLFLSFHFVIDFVYVLLSYI